MRIFLFFSHIKLYFLSLHNNTRYLITKTILNLKGESYVLTLFSAEDEGRTELPTEQKKRRAREDEGRVVNSNEINQTLVLAATVAVLALLMSYYAKLIQTYTKDIFSRISNADKTIDIINIPDLFLDALLLVTQISGIVLLVALIVGVSANLYQTKFLFTMKKIKLDFKRIAPTWKNFKDRAFLSAQNMMNLVKILFKMTVVASITYFTIRARYEQILTLGNVSLASATFTFFYIALEMVAKVIIFLAIISIIDYFFQKKQYVESLKMSKFEMKQEFKEMDGDPLVKAKLQEMSHNIANRNMFRSVPEADVIITNPTHFAVALKYDNATMQAPTVTAKGADHIAFKIREIAKENGVQIIENKPLARELYFNVEVGKYIPEKLFFVISRILGAIYSMKQNKIKNVIN